MAAEKGVDMLETMKVHLEKSRAEGVIRRSRYADVLCSLPPHLYEYWREHVNEEFPDTPANLYFFTRAAEGLLNFFDCVRCSSRPCALPSRAADSVWHAWQKMDEEGLQHFTRTQFGQDIPHVEAAQMGEAGMQEALAATMVACRIQEGNHDSTHCPALFRLDAELGMPFGYGYKAGGFREKVLYAPLDQAGRPRLDWRPHAAFSVGALLAFGLVSQSWAASEVPILRGGHAEGGSSCGSAPHGTSCGSSCGSSCGGD